MKNKILLTVIFACIGLFAFNMEADANNRGRRSKKVIVVKKGPNRGRTIIVKKQRRGKTVIIKRNRNGRTVKTIRHNRNNVRSCGPRRVVRHRARR